MISHQLKLIAFLAASMLIATLFTGLETVSAGEPTTWEVEVDVSSGRPNPIFRLERSEVDTVTQLFSATQAASEATNTNKLHPSLLGYRGTSIRQVAASGQVEREIRVRGKDIREQKQKTVSWRSDKDKLLERYLVDLALQKGAINASLHDAIRKAMAREAGQR